MNLRDCSPSASLAIILLPASAYTGNKSYRENRSVSAETAADPDQAAQAFFQEYLEAFRGRGSDDWKNPLVEKSYRESSWLTKSFIGHIDELLAGMVRAGDLPPSGAVCF